MDKLISILPAVLGFLGGPAGGLAGAGLQWLAGKFGAKDSTVDAIKEALQGFKPDDAIALRKLDIEFQEFCMQHNIALQLAQIEVNKEEAKSSSIFIAGWRPAAGWVGVLAFFYAAFLEPLARFVATLAGYTGLYPEIDTSLTMQVLFGLLGLAGMRSYEKSKNVEGNR